MQYRGYTIKHEKHYYQVTGPSGERWTEDTVEEAKAAIDYEIDVYHH